MRQERYGMSRRITDDDKPRARLGRHGDGSGQRHFLNRGTNVQHQHPPVQQGR